LDVIYYNGRRFYVFEEVYKPAEDTFLLADNMVIRPSEKVLDLGTGCGILAVLSALMEGEVTATDVNPLAERNLRMNSELHSVADRIIFKLGDLFEPVKGEKFDVILFNPPYLPVKEDNIPLGMAWSGGSSGRTLLDRFLSDLDRYLLRRAYMVQSSLSKPEETYRMIEESGLEYVVLDRASFFYEKIEVLEIRV